MPGVIGFNPNLTAAQSWGVPFYRPSPFYPAPPQAYGSFVQSTGYGKKYSQTKIDQLSDTNLYIRGLEPTTTDEDLRDMCEQYGKIASTKAIIDKNTQQCKGYGFVDFDSQETAEQAIKGLQSRGIQAQLAKVGSKQQKIEEIQQQQQHEHDPTNLYIANLPQNWNENNLQTLFSPFGMVISTRILRNQNGESRGVGFARMESKEKCETIIENFNGKKVNGVIEPLLVKFADSARKPKRTIGGDEVDVLSRINPLMFAMSPEMQQLRNAYAMPGSTLPAGPLFYPPAAPGGFMLPPAAAQNQASFYGGASAPSTNGHQGGDVTSLTTGMNQINLNKSTLSGPTNIPPPVVTQSQTGQIAVSLGQGGTAQPPVQFMTTPPNFPPMYSAPPFYNMPVDNVQDIKNRSQNGMNSTFESDVPPPAVGPYHASYANAAGAK